MQNPTVANACAGGEGPPPAIDPHVHCAASDALSEPNVLAKARDIESHGPGEMEDDLGRGHAIVGRPIRIGVVIQDPFRAKGRVVGPNIRSHDATGLLREVLRKDLAYQFRETPQGFRILFMDETTTVWRNVE